MYVLFFVVGFTREIELSTQSVDLKNSSCTEDVRHSRSGSKPAMFITVAADT